MITRIRQYAKKDPSKDAHKLYVICEGGRDEPRYFEFFEGLSSNLNVVIIPSEEGKTDPVRLKDAISNAEANFNTGSDGLLCPFSTEVYLLGKEIYGFVSDELNRLYNKLG